MKTDNLIVTDTENQKDGFFGNIGDPKFNKYIQLLESKAPTAKSEPTFWEIDEEETTKSNDFVDIVLSTKASAKIDTLMRKFDHMEWLAYLVGNDLYIDDIIIPKQEVTVVNVFVDKKGVDIPIMGVIHSHHDMGNNFSHTDDEYINANHNISLCVSKNGYNGQIKIGDTLFNANVITYDNSFDVDSFMKEIDDNIKVKSHNYSYNVSGSNNPLYDTDDFLDVDISNTFIETKDIVGLVNDYMIELKDLSLVNNININEVMFISKLINSIGTDFFDEVESEFYDSESDFNFSDTAVALIDEIDIFNDTLTNIDNVKLNELYVYLDGLTTKIE